LFFPYINLRSAWVAWRLLPVASTLGAAGIAAGAGVAGRLFDQQPYSEGALSAPHDFLGKTERNMEEGKLLNI
jgi:hypothetical protein